MDCLKKTNSNASLTGYEAQLTELTKIERHLTYYNRILEHIRGAAIESLCRPCNINEDFCSPRIACTEQCHRVEVNLEVLWKGVCT
ncbi:unnamed protein product [Trichobilharzia regenti]|nr:unnamed protein product [Trichobilharzia regenti]